MSAAETHDALVVGGGISGLVCARRLQRSGLSVRVLEAADRWGGRLDAAELPGGTVVETGGQWLSRSHHRALALVDELGLTTFPTWTRGRSVLRVGTRRREHRSVLPPVLREPRLFAAFARSAVRLEAMARRLPEGRPWAAPRAGDLDRQSFAAWLERHVRDERAREIWAVGASLTMGGSPEDVSLLFALHHIRGSGGVRALLEVKGGAQELRVTGGLRAIVDRLVADVGASARLCAPVEAIDDDGTVVTVRHGGGVSRARTVVVAMSPAEVKRIVFRPGLPEPQRRLTDELAMVPGYKVNVAYERPFWRESGLSGQALSDHGALPVTFDNTLPGGGLGILVGFSRFDERHRVGLPTSLRDDPEERRRRYLADLVDYFGDQARSAVAVVERDWSAEPWLSGCIPSAPPGLLTAVGEDWRTRHGRVVWAGSERAERWDGYVEGALESAERAAGEVIALVR